MAQPLSIWRKVYVDQTHLENDNPHGLLIVVIYPTYVDAEFESYFGVPMCNTLRKVIVGSEHITYQNIINTMDKITKEYFDWPTYLYQDTENVLQDEESFTNKYDALDKDAEYIEYLPEYNDEGTLKG